MVQFIMWLNPYRKTVKIKGTEYSLREEYIKKLTLRELYFGV